LGADCTEDAPAFLLSEFLSCCKESENENGEIEDEECGDEGVKIRLKFQEEEVNCTTEDLLALMLVGIKQKVLSVFKMTVSSVAVALPATFTDRQRVAVQAAVFKAGMYPRRLISSPLAALVGAIEDPHKKEGTSALIVDTEDTQQEADLSEHVYSQRSPLIRVLCLGMGAGFMEVAAVRLNYRSETTAEGVETGYFGYKAVRVGGLAYGGMDVDACLLDSFLSSKNQRTDLASLQAAREALSTKTAIKFKSGALQEEKVDSNQLEWTLERKQVEKALEKALQDLKSTADSALS